jgi:hypothetical protein
MPSIRALSLLLILLAGVLVFASPATVRLSSFPSAAVADGRSAVTITAEVREANGRAVQDGTQVIFTTTLGNFRESIVQTVNGFARATLITSSIPGSAKITATVQGMATTGVMDFEFLSDRSLLSSALEYMEVVAPDLLMYSMDHRWVHATGKDGRAVLNYRDIEIHADDLQLDVVGYSVRAKKARLKFGKINQEFEQLFFRLNTRRGAGLTTHTAKQYNIETVGTAVVVVEYERPRYGMAEVSAAGLSVPSEPIPLQFFDFEDLEDAATIIHARKIVAFPRKEVHFHGAEIKVGGVTALKLPLFQASISGQAPILTEQIFNVYDNQVAINYPHYISLRPGQTSLLRFRTGQRYGQGAGISRGMFLDYELNWNKGDDLDGGLVVSGLGRGDWGLGARQFLRLNDRTYASLQVDFPARQSIYGSGNFSSQLDGFVVSLNASATSTLRGHTFRNEHATFLVEKDPTKLWNLPIRMTYGFTASHASTATDDFRRTQSGYGVHSRFNLMPQSIDRATTINASLALSHLQGRNTLSGITAHGSASLSRRLSNTSSILLTYDYTDDGLNSRFVGKNRVGLQGFYGSGNVRFSLFGSKSLDMNRQNLFGDVSYTLSDQWRVASGFYIDEYLGNRFSEYNLMLLYRLGFREVGLSWSSRTKRFGFELLGARF